MLFVYCFPIRESFCNPRIYFPDIAVPFVKSVYTLRDIPFRKEDLPAILCYAVWPKSPPMPCWHSWVSL
jgi:hypothetical protein